MSINVDADIDDEADLFDKSASDLQEDIVIGTSGIAGTLKYVADYSSAFGGDLSSGNYLALHITTPDVSGSTITVEIINGTSGPVTLDSDGLWVGRIADKSTQTVKIVASKEGYRSATKTYSLTGLTVNSAT